MTGIIVPPTLFSVAPLIVATVADERRTAIVAGAAVALAVGAVWWHGLLRDGAYRTRIAAACVIGAMAVVVAGIRCRREKRLARMTAIAKASQLALLPPLPPEMTGINIAARYRSATRDASVGGDLYEIIPTSHGIRAVIGDVCGNGSGRRPARPARAQRVPAQRGRGGRAGAGGGRGRPGYRPASGR